MEFHGTIHNFLLVSIIPQKLTDEEALIDLKELKSLVEAYGGQVSDLIVQKREATDKGLYIGKGKITEIAEVVKEKKIQAIVLNAVVKAGQLFEIKSMLHEANPTIQVWDRIDLILQIFAKNANTAESKLQIELAAMRHMGPRIYGMGMVMSRQGGGIGGRGVGETNTELMKRHWSTQMKKVQEKLAKLSGDREKQLERRARIGLKTVSIVGYTNAGKTSLFNTLTGKEKVSDNALFVTLDSSVGKIKLPISHAEVLLSDTIGFINNLPTTLIDAFKSTLMESVHADLLLHVIDVTDADMDGKIRTVEKILSDLGMYKKERIYVFNKIDMLEHIDKDALIEKYGRFSPLFISTKSHIGLDTVIKKIEETIS